jgi:hypothetical protein
MTSITRSTTARDHRAQPYSEPEFQECTAPTEPAGALLILKPTTTSTPMRAARKLP